jgi:predicted heme/steroid binding protein
MEECDMEEGQSFTPADLAEYDGRDGGAAYTAWEGRVYDVTDSPMWEAGLHESAHQAGEDLTEAMADAPHGGEVFDGLPVMGILRS